MRIFHATTVHACPVIKRGMKYSIFYVYKLNIRNVHVIGLDREPQTETIMGIQVLQVQANCESGRQGNLANKTIDKGLKYDV